MTTDQPMVTHDQQPSEVIDGAKEQLLSLELTRQEWTIVFNCLVRQQYGLADALLVQPVVTKLSPLTLPPEVKKEA